MSEWQPIETAPKDGTPVRLYGVRSGASTRLGLRSYEPAHWTGHSWRMLDRPGSFIGNTVHPTHWMPLPAPSADK